MEVEFKTPLEVILQDGLEGDGLDKLIQWLEEQAFLADFEEEEIEE